MIVIEKITEDQIFELYCLAKRVALGLAKTREQEERKLGGKNE